ncbi:hypothetical protein EVAR_83866_1 [Eumeta japonica]|uniref:Uncharacterized protein n=1 Tax=Eumeta variegata TaxID=151549 RepID=A0A4C1USG2_EUMVA|nr:hypothetical protein EVAR_83866_1 [Eumeta japonica]
MGFYPQDGATAAAQPRIKAILTVGDNLGTIPLEPARAAPRGPRRRARVKFERRIFPMINELARSFVSKDRFPSTGVIPENGPLYIIQRFTLRPRAAGGRGCSAAASGGRVTDT